MEKQARHLLVEQLFRAALELPPEMRAGFLDSSCRHDPELLNEVQSLLSVDPDASDSLTAPGAQLVATLKIDQPSSARSYGHYQIIDLIGKGGMGEVYRARDTRLGRDVAIKFVPQDVARDESKLLRLEREGRLLALLNHPNIATIHGLEYFGETRLLVMELVEGETLEERIACGPVPLGQVLGIFQQIAEALEAAHQRGVIHRDLKPANIKVSPDGKVKLLDFGLSKALSEDATGQGTHSASLTESGVVMGTPSYMSPEQARGQRIDKQTDVWAFGCVLYEALSGQRAFLGVSLAEVFANILYGEPDWSKLPAETPSPLLGLVRRCLDKDAAARPQHIPDLLKAIQRTITNGLQSGSANNSLATTLIQDTGGSRPAQPARRLAGYTLSVRRDLSRPAVWLTALILSVAGLITYLFRDRAVPAPQLTNPIQVTRAIGLEDYPTWSPDGATLAYESNQAGNWDIWIAQVGGGPAVNRTAEHPGSDRYPSWSPDGRHISFWSDRDGGGYYLMPAIGGNPQLMASTPGLGDNYNSPLTWSPDSSRLALVIYKSKAKPVEAHARIIALATRDTHEVSLPGSEEIRADLSWSPDGRYVAYLDLASQLSEVSQLKLLRFSDGRAIDLSDGSSNVRSPRWAPDGRQLLFTTNRAGTTDWWRLRIDKDGEPEGEPERLTTGLEVANGAFSPDGRRLAYSKGRWVSNAWRVPILENRPAAWGDAEQLTFDQAFIEFIDVTPDGRELAFSSDRTGNQDLWRMLIGSNQPIQLTADLAPDWDPNWSPDRQTLAYYSYRTGDREIWVMPAAGGSATQLTHSKGVEATGRWSPDGRQIVFRSERTGDSELWVMSSDGTNQLQLTDDPAGDYGGTFSPDGKWITFYSNRSGRLQIWRIRPEGGTPELLSRGPGISPRWAPDGERIIFVGFAERQGNLWILSLKDHTERPLTSLRGKRGTIGYQFPATDGKFIYFTWRDDVGDIWVMDVAKQ